MTCTLIKMKFLAKALSNTCVVNTAVAVAVPYLFAWYGYLENVWS